MTGGYKPTVHQEPLTRMVDLAVVRARRLRSFRRLESAIDELVAAVANNCPIISPRRVP